MSGLLTAPVSRSLAKVGRFSANYPEILLLPGIPTIHADCMDEEFLDLIDQAFLDGQTDGETMVLACIWLQSVQSDSKRML